MPAFATTRWSLIAAARDLGEPAARAAMATLCAAYWQPIYAFIRRSGSSAADAEDLTQAFFARLLEKDGLGTAEPAKGRFRSYLLGACRHFLANEHDRAAAQKRGGGHTTLSLDFADAERRYEPTDPRTAEQIFERRWALTLLDQVLTALRSEYVVAGNGQLFERLQGSLAGSSETAGQLGRDLDMSEGAVRVAIHRLRQHYRDRLREAISDTVETPEEVDDEIRNLFQAMV